MTHPDVERYGDEAVPLAVSPPEVVALLVAAFGHDGRHDPGDELVQAAWIDTADRAGWTFPEALDAIHRHYVDSDAYLSAGAVTRLIRARRALVDRERIKAEQAEARVRHRELVEDAARPERVAFRAHLRRVWRTITQEAP